MGFLGEQLVTIDVGHHPDWLLKLDTRILLHG